MKSIAIIGGGISGLSALHYVVKRFGDSVRVTLYERGHHVGGHIQTVGEDGFVFEMGPNGFLTNQPNTLSLIQDLGLTNQLIEANTKSKKRYVQVKGKLEAFPLDPLSFLNFQPFTYLDSLRLLAEYFQPKRDNSQESVEAFVSRRCGQKTADYLIDPFVSGVYAGDIKRLHMASAFPKMVKLENTYGSLIKGALAQQRSGKKSAPMKSFVHGMGELTTALANRYAHQIQCGKLIDSLDEVLADHIIIATPAYAASRIVEHRYPSLAQYLDSIVYAPIAVVGFGFAPDAFKRKPKGFGYLVPSNQHKEVLGVLVESNVYSHRAPVGQWMVRVMLGGRHHPEIVNDDPKVLASKALDELHRIYGLRESPISQWVKSWPKAIAQYELSYPSLKASINAALSRTKGLSLVGNYLEGVSMNDTILHSQNVVNALDLSRILQ